MRPLGRLIGSLFFFIYRGRKEGGRKKSFCLLLSLVLSFSLSPAREVSRKPLQSLPKDPQSSPKPPRRLPKSSPSGRLGSPKPPEGSPKPPQSTPDYPQTTQRLPRGSPDAPRAENHQIGTPKVLQKCCKVCINGISRSQKSCKVCKNGKSIARGLRPYRFRCRKNTTLRDFFLDIATGMGSQRLFYRKCQ